MACIITGGNSGIGFDVARKMTYQNYDVVLACRNEEKGHQAVKKLKNINLNAHVTYMKLDLSSKTSIEDFVKEFNSSKKELKVLINNAGMMCAAQNKSPLFTNDNNEVTFQVNHLGHFYLTLMLLENLKQNSPSRIVVVASGLHDPERSHGIGKRHAQLDFDNLQLTEIPETFSPLLAYKNSKLANVLFTYELSRRLHPNCGVTVNALCPGWIPNTGLMKAGFFFKCLLSCCCCGKTQTLSQGSDCVVHVATDEKLIDVTGKYFLKCKEARSSEESYDQGVAARLWDFSVDLMHINDSICLHSV